MELKERFHSIRHILIIPLLLPPLLLLDHLQQLLMHHLTTDVNLLLLPVFGRPQVLQREVSRGVEVVGADGLQGRGHDRVEVPEVVGAEEVQLVRLSPLILQDLNDGISVGAKLVICEDLLVGGIPPRIDQYQVVLVDLYLTPLVRQQFLLVNRGHL